MSGTSGSAAKEDEKAKLAKVILGAQIFMAVLLITNLIRGLTLSILWGWFIERLGVPSINVAEAIGIALVVSFLTFRQGEQKGLAEAASTVLLMCAFVLLLGWIVQLFL